MIVEEDVELAYAGMAGRAMPLSWKCSRSFLIRRPVDPLSTDSRYFCFLSQSSRDVALSGSRFLPCRAVFSAGTCKVAID
jgi:hypothetical protein